MRQGRDRTVLFAQVGDKTDKGQSYRRRKGMKWKRDSLICPKEKAEGIPVLSWGEGGRGMTTGQGGKTSGLKAAGIGGQRVPLKKKLIYFMARKGIQI